MFLGRCAGDIERVPARGAARGKMLAVDVLETAFAADTTYRDRKIAVRANEQEQMSKLCRHRGHSYNAILNRSSARSFFAFAALHFFVSIGSIMKADQHLHEFQ
jgi:hypothetical protein